MKFSDALAQIKGQIDTQLHGPEVEMTADAFVAYAADQLASAKSEDDKIASLRLKALSETVSSVEAAVASGATVFKVRRYLPDAESTQDDDQADQLVSQAADTLAKVNRALKGEPIEQAAEQVQETEAKPEGEASTASKADQPVDEDDENAAAMAEDAGTSGDVAKAQAPKVEPVDWNVSRYGMTALSRGSRS